jgi:hypothetical protein
MAGSRDARFVPTLESLDERLTPSVSGPETLVFFLGGVPAPNGGSVVVAPPASPSPVEISSLMAEPNGDATAGDGTKYKMLAAPLILEIDGNQIRHRFFNVVDRTNLLDEVSTPTGLIAVWASEGDGGPKGWLFLAKQQAVAADGTGGPVYQKTFFPAEPTAGDGTITIKGSKILLNATGEGGESSVWIRVTGSHPGNDSSPPRRNLVVVHSMDV